MSQYRTESGHVPGPNVANRTSALDRTLRYLSHELGDTEEIADRNREEMEYRRDADEERERP